MQAGGTGLDIREAFDAYYSALCLFAFKYLHDREAASDIVQDAFLKLLESGKSCCNKEEMKVFLYVVVRNMCLNLIRHQKIVTSYEKSCLESPEYFRDALVEEETARIIRTTVLQLPPRSRQIMLHSMKGLGNQEIATLLGISVNTIKTLKNKSFSLLRHKLRHLFTLIGIIGLRLIP
jgi:RNA polymerase sigma-70 factor (ECF subfamily)